MTLYYTKQLSLRKSGSLSRNDINSIVQWVDENLLTLNTSKCKCILLTCKVNTMPHLFLNNDLIEEVRSYKYLGVTVSTDLKWNMHITSICQRSKKLLGIMYRRFYDSVDAVFLSRLYLSLVRPILECARDPYTQRNIHQL